MVNRSDVAGAAVFTAFVAAATMALSAYVAATGGYFNVGEIMVYTSALLMGPYVGAFAGGVGSMLSDISLGYAQFAPGTLVIKGVEGFVVGYLGRLALRGLSRSKWRAIAVVVGLIVSGIVTWVGTSFYSGDVEFSLVLPMLGRSTMVLNVASEVWLAIGVLAFVMVVAAGFSVEPKIGWLALAVLVGGAVMVTGYYLYEVLVLGMVGALVEVPFNITQATIGLMVSLPLVRSIRRIIPSKVPTSTSPNEKKG
ncbi:MAG: ECF transporter S component [Thaumarchaeota archaeon]|nr:ECF transporter S component [Nitrososphaerota archaeon]